MATIQTRKSVLAIVVEDTEGTPKQPSSATDYVALQTGFSLVPNTETLENAEIRDSIGQAKPIIGTESPTASFNHYLRHSGVEGQAPNFGELLEAALGSTSANSTERSTTTDSTTSLIKLAAGGTDFARGKAVLIKDSTNGYSIRPILSVSTNDLTPGFALANAPGSGVAVGKCVNYSVANESHKSVTLGLYRGNGGSYEVGAGMKINSMGINIPARQLISMAFGLEGSAYFFNPIFITSSNNKLDFNDGDGDFTATIAAGVYKDPNDLAVAIQAAMNAAGAADEYTVTYNNTGAKAGKFTITSDGDAFTIKWNTGANTANTIASTIGYSAAADDSGATSYDSDSAISFAAPHTPSYDDSDPLVAKDNEVLFGDSSNTGITGVQSVTVNFANALAVQEDLTAENGIRSKPVDRRTIKVDVRMYLNQADAGPYRDYRQGNNVAFCYNFGVKSGGNWVPGKCGNIYMPTAVLSSYSIEDLNGLAVINAQLTAYVDAQNRGEFYMNFL